MVIRHRPTTSRSRGFGSLLLKPLAIAGLLFVGLAAYTVINGELRLPFGGGVLFAFEKDDPETTENGLPAGTVAVYACPKKLPAFTKLTRDHLLTKTGLHTVPVVEQAIQPNGLFRADVDGLTRLLGRVLRREKPVNFAFTERDLLPKGTRPGPSAGIPPGKRGMWIDVTQVQGLADTRSGDYVDLVAATTSDASSKVDTNVLGNLTDPVMRARLTTLASSAKKSPQATSWVVARGALVITPMRSRELGGAKKAAKAPTVDEVFLAMTPEDVAKFSQALAQKVTILAAPRSGQPELQPTEIRDSKVSDVNADLRKLLTGGDDQQASFGMVEIIRGGERQTITVPRTKK